MNLRATAASLAALATGLTLAAGPLTAATAADGPPAASAASAKAKPQAYAVTLKAKDDQPLVGKTFVLKGTVKPAAPKQKVVLQKRFDEDGKWKTEATTKLGNKSKFEFEVEATSPKAREYRVVKAKDAKRAKGVSPAVTVTVFGWQSLADLSSRTSENLWTGTATIVGEDFEKSLVGTLSASAGERDYNINRDCLRLRTTVGAGDDSDETATATISVVADGTSRYTDTFGLTESAPVTLSLEGVFRLGFEYVVANPESEDPAKPTGAVAVVGTPEVLCSF